MTHGNQNGTATAPLLQARGIGKSFSGVHALQDVDFDLSPGEVHVLAGENGAGKSTLLNILCGALPPDSGGLSLRGRPCRIRSVADAAKRGIAMIHQELSLVPAMSVVDNLFLGWERAYGGSWMDRAGQRRAAAEWLGQLGQRLDLSAPVERYPVSVQQLIEIAKALARRAGILLMDEPTSALSRPEAEHLFGIVRRLQAEGRSVVFITHRLEEIYRLADRITILRDGRKIGTARRDALPRERLIRWMIGRDLTDQYPSRPAQPPRQDVRLTVKGFSVPHPLRRGGWAVRDASFQVRRGELLGLAGLEGSGNHELLRGLFGACGRAGGTGRVELDGEAWVPTSPQESVRSGVGWLTNDRKGSGLVMAMSATRNLTLAALARFSPCGWLREALERRAAERMSEDMGIRARSLDQPVAELSGGNQQKVALGKWMLTRPRVLLLDEPTRGVDVGARQDIYRLMNRWCGEGVAMAWITSDMGELLAMSDRILVMHRGRVAAELMREEATQERVLQAAMGGGGDREPLTRPG